MILRLQFVELMSDVEKVLDNESEREGRKDDVQDRYPNHVVPLIIIVCVAHAAVHLQLELDESAVLKTEDLTHSPSIVIC